MNTANRFERLMTPGRIGRLTLKNRLITTAMVTQYCSPDGLPTERYIRYHEEKAKGGWGLVITEDYVVTSEGRSFTALPGLWDDSQIPAHTEFVRRVHQAGGLLCCQLFHPGRETTTKVTGAQPVAPSALREPTMPDTPRALTIDEIREIVAAFGAAARRAKECGFDMVEVHGAHGYLVNQFMSGFSNKRADCYGGSMLNRARFALEIVQAIRSECGPDFPLSFRLNVNDHVPGGITPLEAASFAMMLQDAGVDVLNCSQGMYASKENIIPPTAVPHGAFVDDLRLVRKAASVPVVAVGRINDPYLAEAVLASGSADFVGMGRASLADPQLPLKVQRGEEDSIIECVGCCRGCTGQNGRGKPICCILNPLTGREDEFAIHPVPSDFPVVVIGGGVAGCEAAIVAARRGCRVYLYEREERLGGQWALATVPPGKEDLGSFAAWQARELVRAGVTVRTGSQLTGEDLASIGPKAVIVATGSRTTWLPISGLRESPLAVDVRDVLSGKASPRGHVAVLGGGQVGAEAADLLAEGGCRVTVFEMMDSIAADAEASPRKMLLASLKAKGVEMHTGSRVVAVDGDAVIAETPAGNVRLDGMDAVVVAFGSHPDIELDASCNLNGIRVITVGDAASVKDGLDNIREGYEAALSL